MNPAPAAQPLRIAVLISGGGSTLANLIARIEDGRLRGIHIVHVISSRSAVRGVEIARAAGLPVSVIRPRDFSDPAAFSDAIADVLRESGAELAVMGGFLCHWRIPSDYVKRGLNIHPALLPRFGGAGMYGPHVHQAVLAAGERESGCTVHVATDAFDAGPIVAQARVAVLPDDTPDSLAARVGEAERELYPAVLGELARRGVGWLSSLPRVSE